MPKAKSIKHEKIQIGPFDLSNKPIILPQMITTRSIKINQTTHTFTPDEGTPQGCLYHLAQQCIEVIIEKITSANPTFSFLDNNFKIEGTNLIYYFYTYQNILVAVNIETPQGNRVSSRTKIVDPEQIARVRFNSSDNKQNISIWANNLNNISDFPRDWQLRNDGNKTMLIALINTVLNISILLPEYERKLLIIKTFSNLLPKGLSDISQYQALLEYAEKEKQKNIILPITTIVIRPPSPIHLQDLRTSTVFLTSIFPDIDVTNINIIEILQKRAEVFDSICSKLLDPEYVFVSSDHIACAVATFPAKIYDYNLQLLCTRKIVGSGGVLNVVLHKRLMAFCACIIGNTYDDAIKFVNNTNPQYERYKTILEKIQLAKQLFLNARFIDDNEIDSFTDRCIEWMNSINEKYERLHPNNTFIPLCTKLKELDRYFYKDFPYLQYKFEQFAILIQLLINIINDPTNLELLQNISNQFDLNITCRRYGYSLSFTVLKCIMPFTPLDEDNETHLQTSVMVGAVYDIKNGHDFQLGPIKNLGNQFLNYMSGSDDIRLTGIDNIVGVEIITDEFGSNPTYRNGEEEYNYVQTILQKNGYVTMGQVGTILIYRFNNEENLLKSPVDQTYVSTIVKEYLFRALLSTSNIITSIDFTSGTQPFQIQKNIKHNAEVYATEHFRPTDYDDAYTDYLKATVSFFKSVHFYELLSTASFFDGAAIYGLVPLYDIPTLKVSVLFEEITLEVITNTANMRTSKEDQIKFEDRLPRSFKPFREKLINEGLNSLVEYLKTNSQEVKLFNTYWSKKFKKENNSINKSTYISIITRIHELITPLDNSIIPILNRTNTLATDNTALINTLKSFDSSLSNRPDKTVPGYYFPLFYEIVKRILMGLQDNPEIVLKVFANMLSLQEISYNINFEPINNANILNDISIALPDNYEATEDRIRNEGQIKKCLLYKSCAISRPLNREFLARGLKSHKKNKLRRRRTYKRGKEEQFLPTPTKTHKRRHIKTPLERLRAKLQPKSTRRRTRA